MMSFYIFFAGLHLILLILQNTLSIAESRNEPGKHHGSSCVKLCPVITFSIIFTFLALLQIYIVYLQIAQVDFWSYYTTFYFFHNVATVRFFDWILYGCAAVVQLIKICNFVSHNANPNSLVKERHTCFAKLGLVVSFGSLCLILANMYLIMFYMHVGGAVIIAYEAVQTLLMLPLLHLMIIHQEAQGQ